MWVQSLGQDDPLEEEMATHSRILNWGIPWTKEPGELQPIGGQRVGHDWSNLAHMHNQSIYVELVYLLVYLLVNCKLECESWNRDRVDSPRSMKMHKGNESSKINLSPKYFESEKEMGA